MPKNPWGMAVKAIIRDRAGRCLALRRAPDSTRYASQWDLPGGKVDAGERFDEALLREVREETGLQAELTGVVGAWEQTLPKVRSVLLIVEARLRSGWLNPAEWRRLKWSAEIQPVVEAMPSHTKRRATRLAGR